MICALLNIAPWCARLPASFQNRADGGRYWTCRLVPASGVFCPSGRAFFPQTLRIRRLVSTLKPLHIVIHSLTCSTRVAVCGTRFFAEEPCDCGNGARLGFTHHRAHFEVFAHRIDLCGGRSLRSVAIYFNRLSACHHEFLRLRVDLAQTINSLGPASAFPYAFPSVKLHISFFPPGFRSPDRWLKSPNR